MRRKEGKRLDAKLAELLPEMGLRGRRRLINSGFVLVNGRPGKSSDRVGPGDRIGIESSSPVLDPEKARLLEAGADYCCFWKGAGLHTVVQAGSCAPSLELAIPSLMPQAPGSLRLLQRLDFNTAGLVCAARNEKAIIHFREAEKSGLCKKFYLAIIEGRLEEAIIVKNSIDSNGGKKSRVLAVPGDRHTGVEPLLWLTPQDLSGEARKTADCFTIVRCILGAGARHQIRAHLAWLGYPLAGDALYGSAGTEPFMLEHYRLEFPGHSFRLPAELSLFWNNKRLRELVHEEYELACRS